MIEPIVLDTVHQQISARGWKLLQPYRFGDTDESHVAALLDAASFPNGARVLDVGCGVGECARLMREQRPDLEFVLVNFSAAQLADCPAGMEKHQADAHCLPFGDESFDAVMFHAALGNMDAMVAIAEASRVLRPGGVLFLNEIERLAGDNILMDRTLAFCAYGHSSLVEFSEAMGLSSVPLKEDVAVTREWLRDQWESLGDDLPPYDVVFSGTQPRLWRFIKGDTTPLAAKYGPLFHRHQRIALQVSGGKDSLAAWHAFRPWWDRLCVYWLNPGNPFPETVEMMDIIQSAVPYFREISGRQKEIIAADGWPSDVVPTQMTTMGQLVFGEKPFKVQGRMDCCFRSLMAPMHEAMYADGVTCVIRGKRSEEKDKSPTRSGDVIDGIELVYPLWDWSEPDVLDYLAEHGIPLPAYYEHANHSLDCMDCSAWWGEGLSKFLKAKYPEQHAQYVERVGLIKAAIAEQMADCEV